MKKINKILALVVALMMVLAAVSAFAAETGSITITPPDNATGTNNYKIYKVFDAVADGSAISYKVMSGKSGVPDGFTLDDAGNVYLGTVSDTATGADNEVMTKIGGADKYITPQTTELTKEQIAAVKAYIEGDDPITTATSEGTADATAANLANGYYYIETTTGTLVTITSTKPNAEVIDKNTLKIPDKTIYGVDYGSFDEDGQKALAQLGATVSYQVEIEVGNGAKNYIFHDQMGTGLTYNNDVKVYIGEAEVAETNYDKTTATGDTITVKFTDEYIASVVGQTLVVKYSATVNSDALTIETGKNTASISYGDNNSVIPSPHEPVVYNAKFTVTKKDGDGQPLAGAGFVLKNAEGKYYKLENNVVSWVDTEEAATEYTSDAQGAVTAFTGLADGTYTLVEKTVPEGYNKAADKDFTIAKGDYTAENLEQTADVVNNSGAELPSTGGIGTTIFYVAGSVMALAAAILLVTRRRMNSEN